MRLDLQAMLEDLVKHPVKREDVLKSPLIKWYIYKRRNGW